jgi:Flp pilus assembly protein TadD
MVSINSNPSGAEVVVDKVHVARTPFSVSLDPGPHALQFRKDGYQPRAEIIQVSKQGEKDIKFALKPLKLSPELAAQHSSQGMALYKRGDWNGAVAEFQEAIRLYPYDAMTHSNLALALQKKGDRDGAIAQYREAIRLKPPSKQNLLMIRNNLAVALYLKGDWEGAANEFHEVIQLKPEDATAHRNLARALLKQGDLDSAIAHLREALQIQPTYSDAQQELNALLAQRAANQ